MNISPERLLYCLIKILINVVFPAPFDPQIRYLLPF